MTKLVSLYGKREPVKIAAPPQYQFSLFSMSGTIDPSKLPKELLNDPILTADPRDLSDIDAGIQVLYAITKKFPNITFGDLLDKKNKMGGLLKAIGNFGNWCADKAGAVGDKLGDWGGDAIRLLTDREVRDGLKDYGAAYATGGQSVALEKFLGGQGGEGEGSAVNGVMNFLSNLGKGSKQEVRQASFSGGIDFSDPKIMALGAGGLILLVLLLNK